MQKARSVEATCDRPCRAAQPRWLFNLRRSLADSLPISLPQCAGNHMGNEQQQDDENGAPTEIPDDGGGALLLHVFIQLLVARSNSLIADLLASGSGRRWARARVRRWPWGRRRYRCTTWSRCWAWRRGSDAVASASVEQECAIKPTPDNHLIARPDSA
jgi:hypothetical protein